MTTIADVHRISVRLYRGVATGMVLDALRVESEVCRMLPSSDDVIGCSGYVHGSSRQRD